MENIDISESQSINTEEVNLESLFSGKYLFEIPIYQRPYAWQDEQVLQLLEDLFTSAFEEDDDEPYFMGSLVIVKKDATFRKDIIDGQQRLTTLTILLSALRCVINDEEIKGNLSDMLVQEGNRLKRISTEYRLKTRERDQDFFCRLIQSKDGLNSIEALQKEVNSDSQQNILDNAKLILNYFKEHNYNEEQLIEFAQYVIIKCVFIVVSAMNKEKAFKIFKVLNGRGMPLSMADIFKAEILETIKEEQLLSYGQKWEETEEFLGEESFEKLFTHIRSIELKREQKGSILEDIKNNLKPHENSIYFIDKLLLVYAEAFSIIKNENFRRGSFKRRDKINNELYWLNQLSYESWLPPAILFISMHKETPAKVNEFLSGLNKLTLGLGILGVATKDRTSRLYKLLIEIGSGKEISAFKSLSLTRNEKVSIKKKVSGVRFLNKNQKFAKSLLLKIEEKEKGVNEKHIYNSISIEHVLPQNPMKNSTWNNNFTSKEQKDLTNQIGNLVLLSIQKNKNAGNKEFKKKKSEYLEKGNIPVFELTKAVISEEDWKPKNIKERTEKIASLACEIFEIEK